MDTKITKANKLIFNKIFSPDPKNESLYYTSPILFQKFYFQTSSESDLIDSTKEITYKNNTTSKPINRPPLYPTGTSGKFLYSNMSDIKDSSNLVSSESNETENLKSYKQRRHELKLTKKNLSTNCSSTKCGLTNSNEPEISLPASRRVSFDIDGDSTPSNQTKPRFDSIMKKNGKFNSETSIPDLIEQDSPSRTNIMDCSIDCNIDENREKFSRKVAKSLSEIKNHKNQNLATHNSRLAMSRMMKKKPVICKRDFSLKELNENPNSEKKQNKRNCDKSKIDVIGCFTGKRT